MTSRERVMLTLNHKQPDRVPIDFGATPVTGIAASFIYKLRQTLGLPEKPVRIYDPYQMLGEVDEDLRKFLEVDVMSPWPLGNLFGFDNEPTEPFTMPDGTPVLVPKCFNTTYEANGELMMYARGDRSYPPSAMMPSGGHFFDTIVRQNHLDDDHLDAADNLQESQLLTDDTLRAIEKGVDDVYKNTDYAIVGNPGTTALGDIALVAGPMLPDPRGVRDIAEWYMSPLLRPDYVKEIFARQVEIAIKNLSLYKEAVGDKVNVIYLCGADFGSQISLMCSVESFREFYLPYYKIMTDWIHKNTSWKVFKHSCGAVEPLIESFIEAGIDILNPVQCSATGMDAETLKSKYGSRIVFWGGGIDTQKTLQTGSPAQIEAEVKSRMDMFGKDGGFVFNTIHNTQANVPVVNFLSMVDAIKTYRSDV